MFLDAARADLQAQLGRTGRVEGMRLDDDLAGGATLVATVRVAGRLVEVTGTGGDLVAAYATLHRAAPERLLATAFQAILGGREPSQPKRTSSGRSSDRSTSSRRKL